MGKTKKEKQAPQVDVEDLELEDEVEEAPAKASKKDKKTEKNSPKNKDTKQAGSKVEGDKKTKASKKGEPLKHMQVPDNMVTVADLESEFGKTGKEIRTIIRDNDFERAEGLGRWAWKKSDPELKRLRGILSGANKVKKEAPSKKEEAPAPTKKKKK